MKVLLPEDYKLWYKLGELPLEEQQQALKTSKVCYHLTKQKLGMILKSYGMLSKPEDMEHLMNSLIQDGMVEIYENTNGLIFITIDEIINS